MTKNCPHCTRHLDLTEEACYCPMCGQSLNTPRTHISYVPGLVPEEGDVQFQLQSYKVINKIGQGGMGEVFLAYDPICGRQLAIKRIRTDFESKSPLRNRFLKEARITSQLTHPAIIPIYNIHLGDDNVYYTMPFVEGKTLKQIFRDARKLEKEGLKSDDIGGGIPALTRVFLSVCQAIAYAHSHGVLHRDIKPENIIVGKYGQVVILDWGLAKVVDEIEEEEDTDYENSSQLTNIGKVVGTINYMAPERAHGSPATIQTDIYSLGVILYQILTLKYPFIRGTLKEFKQSMKYELLHDPAEMAPYRDVPRPLSVAASYCLAPNPEDRYATVDDLIKDVESYIEGRSEWFEITTLDINKKEDWEFQENVLIAENIAITRGTDVTDWVMLMISKASLGEHLRIETRIKIEQGCDGIGFLFNVPEEAERKVPNDGYCLWLASEKELNSKLIYSTIEVMQAPEIYLKYDIWYQIRIEKIDNNIYCYLNDQLQFTYVSHLPRAGTHIGVLTRDAKFILEPIYVYLGGQNVQVSCLAIPDAFLAHKDYVASLNEYRRIGYAFSGRAEGREAMFRAGITLLEKAKNQSPNGDKIELYDAALDEFGKLHKTPGAPLEYLGKGLVYHTLHDYDEEIKCYDLACRRYPKHPLLPVLHEQILYRMHECSRYHPRATYAFILLALCHLPNVYKNKKADRLFQNLQAFWEKIPFFEQEIHQNEISFMIQLAFWLGKAHILLEIISRDEISCISYNNAVFSLLELGAWKLAKDANRDALIQLAITSHENDPINCFNHFLENVSEVIQVRESRVLFHILSRIPFEKLHECCDRLEKLNLSDETKMRIHVLKIRSLLWTYQWEEASKALHEYSLDLLTQERTPLFFLYGCLLLATEGKEIADIHFSSVLHVAYPRSWTLGAHYIKGDIYDSHSWFNKAFPWDMRHLYDQLELYYHCSGDYKKEAEMRHRKEKVFLDPEGISVNSNSV